MKVFIYYFLISIAINISFCLKSYSKYTVIFNRRQDDLEIMQIKINDDICPILTPSLFSPILLLPADIYSSDFIRIDGYSYSLILPNFEYELRINLYSYPFLNKYNNFVIGKERFFSELIKNCYFGLSYGNDINEIDQNYFLLNQLYLISEINKKIFSFDKWEINENSIITNFYFGDVHENFKSNNGIIATCKNDGYPYWGCSFHEMIFNNNYSISLEYEKGKYYKIFFATETNDIMFPEVFKDLFNYFTKGKCKNNLLENSLYCDGMFDKKEYLPLKLINENMNITVEIDSQSRFNTSDYERILTNKTRIYFRDINYIIFPLIMFKQFHIQFDADNGIISFYTTNNSILEIPNTKNESNKKNSSKLIISLSIIISVLVILILGYTVFRLIRKKKESNIQNDTKKIEEIEEFHSMK